MTERIPFYDDLLEAFAEPGCAICRLLAQNADKFVDSILYESVNDPPTREKFNDALGYCTSHAQLMLRAGAALGVTIMLDNILKILLRTLEANPVEKLSKSHTRHLLRNLKADIGHPATAQLANQLTAQTDCPVCVDEATNLKHYGRTLLQHTELDNTIYQAYEQSDGLCLDHFRAVVSQALPGPGLTAVVTAQKAIWLRLHVQAETFIRKNDHRFRGKEPFGPEKDVWLRTLTAVSGAPIKNYVNPKSLTQ